MRKKLTNKPTPLKFQEGKPSFNSNHIETNHIERVQKSPVKMEIMDLIHPCWTTTDVNRFTAGMILTKRSYWIFFSDRASHIKPIIVLLHSVSQQQWFKKKSGFSLYNYILHHFCWMQSHFLGTSYEYFSSKVSL